jgi:hypothetical protein
MAITLDGTNGLTLPGTSTGVQLGSLTSGTAQATTSGTAIDFTGIPNWVKRITVIFNGVATTGTVHTLVQLGSGSFTSTGYLSYWGYTQSTTNISTTSSTAGFGIWHAGSADIRYTHMILTNISGNIWVSSHSGGMFNGSANFMITGGGNVTLSGTLDRIRITPSNGSDTFTAGSVNILYE